MRNNVKKATTKIVGKSPLMKRMIVNKIRPGISRSGLTDDDTLRFVVTKTYIEEGRPMSIIVDDFLHFAIRAGEIWMEPYEEEKIKKKPRKKTAAKKAKKKVAAKKAVRVSKKK